jgi:integrase
MARKERGEKIAPGIWKDEFGYAVQVAVGSGRNKLQREERFAFDTKLKAMTNWQDETRGQLRKRQKTKHGKGTLAADVEKYLRAVASMASYADRARDLALWVAKFPNRARHSIKAHEISAVSQGWLQEGYAPMTVYNRRTALQAVWTTLDGRRAENPVDESFSPDLPTLTAKDLPLPIIDRVLDAVEDRGQGIRGQTRGTVSKTKIRLRLLAYTGLPHKLMKQITRDRIDWDGRKVFAAKRRKGTGVDERWLPLGNDAYEALVDFDKYDCYGEFSNSSMRQTWRRAWRWVHRNWPEDKPIPYPYQLRHSFATAIVQQNGDDKAVAGLLMHSPKSNITPRYTIGAVPDRMQKGVEAFTERRLTLVKNAKPARRGRSKQKAS